MTFWTFMMAKAQVTFAKSTGAHWMASAVNPEPGSARLCMQSWPPGLERIQALCQSSHMKRLHMCSRILSILQLPSLCRDCQMSTQLRQILLQSKLFSPSWDPWWGFCKIISSQCYDLKNWGPRCSLTGDIKCCVAALDKINIWKHLTSSLTC